MVTMPTSSAAELLAVKSLDGLPAHRREWLLWRRGLTGTRADINADLRRRAKSPCPDFLQIVDVSLLTAVLGDDGRWHLRHGKSKWLCHKGRLCDDRAEGDLPLHYDTYQTNPEMRWTFTGSPDDAAYQDWLDSWRHYSWAVKPTGNESDPTMIRPRERCPSLDWPSFLGSKTAIGRLRATLIAEFGHTCQGCGRQPGIFVDHDHRSWRVRGILCVYCNTNIDDCPHIAGCSWASYLEDPPAYRLALRYPPPDGQDIERYLNKAEQLRADPFGHLPEWRSRLCRYPHLRRGRPAAIVTAAG